MADFKVTIIPTPQNCWECPMYVDKGWGDLKDYCHLTYDLTGFYDEKRHKNCPLQIQTNNSKEKNNGEIL